VYDVAVGEVFHVNDGLIATPVAVSWGERSEGAAGGAIIVVKVNADEYELDPPTLLALTLQ
jgi:hypothetical protein